MNRKKKPISIDYSKFGFISLLLLLLGVFSASLQYLADMATTINSGFHFEAWVLSLIIIDFYVFFKLFELLFNMLQGRSKK